MVTSREHRLIGVKRTLVTLITTILQKKNFKRLENLTVSKGFCLLLSSFANHKTGHVRIILVHANDNDINVYKQIEIFWDSRIRLSLSFPYIAKRHVMSGKTQTLTFGLIHA